MADLSLIQPLAVADGVAEIVYTSHLFEHLSDESVQNLVTEAHRMLKPGGVFRITCPDHELAYQAYKDIDMRFLRTFSQVSKKDLALKNDYKPITGIKGIPHTIESAFLIRFARQVPMRGLLSSDEVRDILTSCSMEEASNQLTAKCEWDYHRKHPHYHINWFTKAKLFAMLGRAGFSRFYASGYGQSRCAVLRNLYHFDSTRPTLSLYVEAVKA